MNIVHYVEVTCPCCDRYRSMTSDQIIQVAHRVVDKSNIVCDDCWKVFRKLLRKHKRQAPRGQI
jgi:NMD protein affecting ribosome stability and mRNA decay